jgi:hypothetical protein
VTDEQIRERADRIGGDSIERRQIAEAIREAVAAEREACARLVESECDDVSGEEDHWRPIVAKRIRSRP